MFVVVVIFIDLYVCYQLSVMLYVLSVISIVITSIYYVYCDKLESLPYLVLINK